jgi:pteridine reductase
MREPRVAVVTGAGRRVGRVVALTLADMGCDVGVHYRASADAAQETANEVRARGRRAVTVCADLAMPGEPMRVVNAVVEALGRLDILVNNASLFRPSPLGKMSEETWHEEVQVNCVAPAMLVQAAEKYLQLTDHGKVINLCDITADRPWRHHLIYCATKAALVNLTRSLALALAPRVQVNGISPGVAEFPESYSRELKERIVSRVPLRRPGSPEDVAAAVRYLCEGGNYVTGQILCVDGGRSIA